MKKNSYGQTLIEMAIALSVVLLTLAAIAILVTTSVSNSTFIKSQTLASKYSQEGMEYVRYLRNNNMTEFSSKSGSGTWCMYDKNSALCNGENICIVKDSGPCLATVGNQFKREVEFPPVSLNCSDQTEVKVSVFWTSGKCTAGDPYCHSSVLVSCFDSAPSGAVNL